MSTAQILAELVEVNDEIASCDAAALQAAQAFDRMEESLGSTLPLGVGLNRDCLSQSPS